VAPWSEPEQHKKAEPEHLTAFSKRPLVQCSKSGLLFLASPALAPLYIVAINRTKHSLIVSPQCTTIWILTWTYILSL
jgi:hypothetical protein